MLKIEKMLQQPINYPEANEKSESLKNELEVIRKNQQKFKNKQIKMWGRLKIEEDNRISELDSLVAFM